MLSELDSAMDRAYGDRKRNLFQNIGKEVVEIGPGAGANFRYYPPGTRILAIEPNLAMHARLRQRAAMHGLSLRIDSSSAESIPLAAETTAAVVGTLVLCSVRDPPAVLAEIQRVLRPGGRYIFVEHVAAKKRTFVAMQQRLLRRPWRFLFSGCRVDQETLGMIEASSFDTVAFDEFSIGRDVLPFSPHVSGIAVK